jgi:C1A family cysteine protease
MEEITPKCKLLYKFQNTDHRDYVFKAEPNAVPKLSASASASSPASITRTQTFGVRAIPPKTTIFKAAIPASFSVSILPNILDQGSLGDCVANAFYYTIMSQTNRAINLSRLSLYAISRTIDYTPLNQDSGTTIRSSCQAIAKYGVCKEEIYPYKAANFINLPPLTVFQNSKLFRTFTYSFVKQDWLSIKTCLITNNTPIIFGIMVYSSFLTTAVAKTGIAPMPNTKTERFAGGHCMTIVGYNDATQTFTCANSWGTNWGNKGYCYLPYAYVTNETLARDFCFTKFVY